MKRRSSRSQDKNFIIYFEVFSRQPDQDKWMYEISSAVVERSTFEVNMGGNNFRNGSRRSTTQIVIDASFRKFPRGRHNLLSKQVHWRTNIHFSFGLLLLVGCFCVVVLCGIMLSVIRRGFLKWAAVF